MFLHQNVEIFQKNTKSEGKTTLGTVLDFAYLKNYCKKENLYENKVMQSFQNQKCYEVC